MKNYSDYNNYKTNIGNKLNNLCELKLCKSKRQVSIMQINEIKGKMIIKEIVFVHLKRMKIIKSDNYIYI